MGPARWRGSAGGGRIDSKEPHAAASGAVASSATRNGPNDAALLVEHEPPVLHPTECAEQTFHVLHFATWCAHSAATTVPRAEL